MLPWVLREAGNRTHMLRIGNPQVSERAPNCIAIITPPPIVQGANQFWNLSCVLGNPWVAAKHPDLSRSKSAYQPFRASRRSLLQKARVPAWWRKSSQAAFLLHLDQVYLGASERRVAIYNGCVERQSEKIISWLYTVPGEVWPKYTRCLLTVNMDPVRYRCI